MREFDKKMMKAKAELNLMPGDIYEDCSFHPVLCVGVDYGDDSVWGISLIDGSHPRTCSLVHCGIRKLTVDEAWDIKNHGPIDITVRDRFKPENRWWK